MGSNYKKFIKSNWYSPSTFYGILCKSDFVGLEPLPLAVDIVPTAEQRPNVPQMYLTRYGNVLKGSVLSYQQEHLKNAGENFENNVQLCLNQDKQVNLVFAQSVSQILKAW